MACDDNVAVVRMFEADGSARRLFTGGSTRSMRITLVTETFFPQVNGVSRTLGELARHLRSVVTTFSLSARITAPQVNQERCSRCRPSVLPFYKELHLPRPPFGRVHRAVAAFRPDIVHIATEATLGWSLLRYALKRGLPVVSSFHTNFDQYSGHYGVGWAEESDLAIPALVSQQHAGDVRSVERHDPHPGKEGLPAAETLAARG